MAVTKSNGDDLETWLEGLGSLREKLLQQGLKTKEELLWLSQDDIDKMCQDNGIPLFEKKRLEMKLLALQALNKTERTPSPNGSVSAHKSTAKHRSTNRHKRNDSNFSNYSTKGGDDHQIMTDDGYGSRGVKTRQPTIVRIVFSEAEEAKLNELDDKLMNIKDKIDQIMHNMSSLNWEKDRLEKKIDKQFDEFVLQLQRRREDVKTELNEITSKQMSQMKKYIQTLNKQTKQIRDTQKKCEKYLSNTSLSKSKRKSKVLGVADKALSNKSDEKIIIPEIINKKKQKNHKKKKEEKNYFVSMVMDDVQIKRYIQQVGVVRRVMVPHPPKFEIFTIEATRIKIKVWDQQHSSNVFGKHEKTEFVAKIAEQVAPHGSRSLEDIDSFDQMASNIPEEEDHHSNIIEEGNDEQNDKKENDDEEDEEDHAPDGEEHKYNANNQRHSRHKSSPKSSHSHRIRDGRKNKKKERSRKHHRTRIDWDQYPVFKPHDANKVMSSKYTIWIENLKPNTTYLLKLRGVNKYGNGDWTKVYSIVTKLTSFEFKSSVIKEAPMKNAVFEILCKKLQFGNGSVSHRSGSNDSHHPFALKRIFSTEQQGFSAKKFHEVCDNKAKTLIIAESEYGNIFGGYTQVNWVPSKSGKFQTDANAFLFLLRNAKKHDTVQVFDCMDHENATRSDINSGPCFGAGIDLLFCDACNKIANSYSTPKSYNIPQNVVIGGKKNFRIKNYDVYIVV
eukprot:132588_1